MLDKNLTLRGFGRDWRDGFSVAITAETIYFYFCLQEKSFKIVPTWFSDVFWFHKF